MKKTLMVILALVLALSALPVGMAEGETLDISWIGFGAAPTPDGELEKMLEERFNVNLDAVQVDASDTDAINLFLTDGGTFDVMNLTGGANIFNTCVEQQLIRSFPVEWLEEYMPTWLEKAASFVGGDVETLIDQCSVDGELYAVPLLMANFVEPGIFLIRQDWLDNLGLEMPTDLESFHEVLRAFTFDDPDGNGVDDTYGMNGNGRYYFNYIFAYYGMMKNSYYVQDDGSVVFTSATEAYKECMETLAAWYAEGIIDPETVTDDRTKQREKWAAGKFGVLPDNASWCNGQLQTMVLDVNPDAVISYMPAFEGYGSYVDYPSALGNQGAFVFGYDTTDEECIRIMQIKEAFAAENDLYDRFYWGVEGVDYNKTEDGLYVRPETSDGDERTLAGIGYFWAIQPKSFEQYNCEIPKVEYIVAHEVAQANPGVYHGKNFYVSGENESASWYGADVSTIAEEYYGQVLMGTVNIDETWDAYVESLKSAGMDKICTEYAEMLAK